MPLPWPIYLLYIYLYIDAYPNALKEKEVGKLRAYWDIPKWRNLLKFLKDLIYIQEWEVILNNIFNYNH